MLKTKVSRSLFLTIIALVVGTTYLFAASISPVQESVLYPRDGAPDLQFGANVAIDGNTAVVSAVDYGSDNLGAAYVYRKTNRGWRQTAILTASDGELQDRFGEAVAISGSTIAISAWGDNDFEGSIYIFENKNGRWIEETKLTANDSETLGYTLAMDDKTIVAYSNGIDGDALGAAYVFEKVGSNWEVIDLLIAPDRQSGDEFALTGVDVHNNIIVIGNAGDDEACPTDGFCDSGAIYVFQRRSRGWRLQTKIIPQDNKAHDYFGYAVAVSNGRISATGGLSTYVFEQNGSDWIQTDKLVASDGTRLTGITLDMDDETILVESAEGAHIFTESGNAWLEFKLPSINGFYKSDVALSGNRIIINATLDDEEIALIFAIE